MTAPDGDRCRFGEPLSSRRRNTVSIAAVFASTLALSAHAGTTVTVQLKGGTAHDSVECLPKPLFSILELKRGETTFSVSYSDIEAVIDNSGENIAPALLGMRYRPRGLENVGIEAFQEAESIRLASGDVLSSTRFILNRNRRELLVLDGAHRRAIPWDRIEAIIDRHGMNVTAQLLGMETPPPVPADTTRGADRANAPDSAAAAGPARARSVRPDRTAAHLAPRWRVAGELRTGYDLPFGDYYDGTSGGVGADGIAHIALTNSFAIRLAGGLVGMDFDSGFGLVSLDPSVDIVSQDYDIDTWRFMAGAEYHAPLSRWNPQTGFWYVHSSMGAIRHVLQADVVVRSGSETAAVSTSTTDTRFAMALGIGVVRRMRGAFAVSGGVDFDFVWTEALYTDGTSAYGLNGFVPSVRVGVGFVR